MWADCRWRPPRGKGLERIAAQSKQQGAVCLQVSAALVASLRRCLAPDVFVRPLADKFARLALQLVARYAAWLQGGLGGDSAADHRQQGGEAGAAQVAAPPGLLLPTGEFSIFGAIMLCIYQLIWQNSVHVHFCTSGSVMYFT